MHDVCVIGAGPSGSACALKLGENYKTSLIEKDEFGGKTNVCAGGLDVLTLEKLDLGEEAIEKRLDGLIIKDSKGLISEKKLECISVQRSVFDRKVAEKAAKVADYFTNTKITKIERINDYWELSSEKEKFKAKIVVFADGPVSGIRNKLGIGFKPSKINCSGAIIKEYDTQETGNNLEFVFDEKVSPVGFGWLFPKKKHVNIGLGYLSNTNCNAKESMDYLLKNYYPEFYGKKPFLERGALVPAKIAEKLSDSRGLICVGDAGGFVEPLTGAGINFGVMSAFEAAKIIDGAFKENDVSKVNEFYPKMKELGWPQLFKVQSAFLKTVNKRQFIYNNFFPAFFGKGGYEKTMGKALKLMGVKNYFAKGVSIQ